MRFVARMERSGMRDGLAAAPKNPDCATLHPDYSADEVIE
jgi:hypothetical protein